MPTRSETDEERRRRRRALIRAQHPDRGGDPAEFIRVLHEFVRRRLWWQGAVSLLLLRRTSPRPKRVV
jgi:hypothetical protein